MTAAKIQMIEASKSPIDEIYDHLVENMEGDLATRKQVTVHVKRVARALGFDQIEGSPQNAVRRIWRQMGASKPGEKYGRSRMNDDYDWAEDAIASYTVAIDSLRERYLEERLPGESAREWLERTSRDV